MDVPSGETRTHPDQPTGADARPDEATKPWQARMICCGRDDGIARFATRGDAEYFRSSYTAAIGHDRVAIITGPADQQDTAAILADYLRAMRADKQMRAIVEDCLALLALLTQARERAVDALELLLARIHRDLPGDGSELPPPEDEFWARQLDNLVRYADEIYQPIADAAPQNPTPQCTAEVSDHTCTCLTAPTPTAPHAKH